MRRYEYVLVALMVMWAPGNIGAQDTEWNRYTLEGLDGVYISAEASGACEAAGVTASSVQVDASLRLIETEVGVLTEEEMLALPGLPELRITLECVTGQGGVSSGTLAFTVGLRVQQAAKLIRDSQVTLAEAVTWYSTLVGVTDSEGAQAAITDALNGQLDGFA